MDTALVVLIGVVVLALIFDFINGFHDSANSIATVVATRVLTPLQAVSMAAFFNFISFLVFPLAVADTISKTIAKDVTDNGVIAAALIGASGWNLITWRLGLPSSSSHALVGALVGAAMTKWFLVASVFNKLSITELLSMPALTKTLIFIVLAPIIGMLLGGGIALLVTWLIARRMVLVVAAPVIGLVIFGVAGYSAGFSSEPLVLRLGTGHSFATGLSMTVWGAIFGALSAVAVWLLFRDPRPRKLKTIFRRGQIMSSAFYSLGHGGNDAQKTMGIIVALLLTVPIVAKTDPATGAPVVDAKTGQVVKVPALSDVETDADGKPKLRPVVDKKTGKPVIDEKTGKPRMEKIKRDPHDYVPFWVVFSCYAAMGLGTLMGGWKIVKTMGKRLIHLRPVDGFCAEFGAATTLVGTQVFGIPVSTTQTITGSIVGVGNVNSISGVKWDVFERIIWAWVLTIPGAFLIAAVSWWVLDLVAKLFG